MCDVSVNFESNPTRLQSVHSHKVNKYAKEQVQWREEGYSCLVHALVYGPLGAHLDLNYEAYKVLFINNKSRVNTLQKTITRSILLDSFNIWGAH